MAGEIWVGKDRPFDCGLLVLGNKGQRRGKRLDSGLVTSLSQYAYIAVTPSAVRPEPVPVEFVIRWGELLQPVPADLEFRWSGFIKTPSRVLELGELDLEDRMTVLARHPCGEAVAVRAYSDDECAATRVLLVVADVVPGAQLPDTQPGRRQRSVLPPLAEDGQPLLLPAAVSHYFEWSCLYIGDNDFDGTDVVSPSPAALVGWSQNLATIELPGPDDLDEFDEEPAPRIDVFLGWSDVVPPTHPWRGTIEVPSRRLFAGDANGYGLIDVATDRIEIAVRLVEHDTYTTGVDILLIRP